MMRSEGEEEDEGRRVVNTQLAAWSSILFCGLSELSVRLLQNLMDHARARAASMSPAVVREVGAGSKCRPLPEILHGVVNSAQAYIKGQESSQLVFIVLRCLELESGAGETGEFSADSVMLDGIQS